MSEGFWTLCSIHHFHMPDTKLDPNKFTQPKMKKKHQTRWWQLTYFLCSPRKLEEMNPSWRAYFFRSVGKKQPTPSSKDLPPGDSKWPFDPLVGGHLTPWKGHLTIPKRSQRIARPPFFRGDWSTECFWMSFSWLKPQAFTHQWRHFQWTLSRGSRFFGFRLLEFLCKKQIDGGWKDAGAAPALFDDDDDDGDEEDNDILLKSKK